LLRVDLGELSIYQPGGCSREGKFTGFSGFYAGFLENGILPIVATVNILNI